MHNTQKAEQRVCSALVTVLQGICGNLPGQPGGCWEFAMGIDAIEHVLRLGFNWLGLGGMSLGIMVMLASAIVIGCIILGYIGDTILEANSFGVAMNGVLMLTGALATLILWRYFEVGFRNELLLMSLVAAGFGGGVLLMASVVMRRYL
jgi:hypothetical protein